VRGWADGTGGPNGTAEFNQPLGVAVDLQGNVYVADTGNNRIRRIDTMGNVTTLAGNGSSVPDDQLMSWSDGSGGPDGSAEFDYPFGVAVDIQGNVYVADLGNNRIRQIDAKGNVTTLAGDGSFASVDGTSGPNGTARIYNPGGVAVDGHGNVYLTEPGAIRRIDRAGQVATLAGSGGLGNVDGPAGPHGPARFNQLAGVAVDARGNVYVADTENRTVRRLDPAGLVTTVTGQDVHFADGTGGPNGTAEFWGMRGVAVDPQGNVYVTDRSHVRRVDAAGNVTTVAGNGTPGSVDGTGGPNGTAEFDDPGQVALDSLGNLYVAEWNSGSIRKVDRAGNVTTFAANGMPGWQAWSGSPNRIKGLGDVSGVAVDAQGSVYVSDSGYHCVWKIDAAGHVTLLAGDGRPGHVDGPGGPLGTAEFNVPVGIAADEGGNVYVADSGNNCIRKIAAGGNVTTLAGNDIWGWADGSGGPNGTARFWYPRGMAVDTHDNVYVADSMNNRIRKIDRAGQVTTLAGTGVENWRDGPNSAAEFTSPYGVVVDVQGHVYVADGSNRVRRITP
jgi:sugar lactone lactonase YvrE